ncbi:hypothetical protein COM13_18905 [Bacillus pseudomycoides]|nr:hypothetical protein COO07_17515 [Bacillus pseudomycoides]PEK80734.1 hypothetical protein CN597_09995 [Bacillus pseudomycoides]PEN08122.1 hypothetical protein CN640_13890 [Bacillus pseudomycoides]PGB87535.1 hypothetical protein COM13_18905 [Bacillus pseudomycoides]PGS04537.1 hypothetical protein COC54_12675 [Bacillus pseudomycoides]
MARMDSNMTDSSCENMTRIELVYTMIRNMVRELSKMMDLEIPESYLGTLKKDIDTKPNQKKKALNWNPLSSRIMNYTS